MTSTTRTLIESEEFPFEFLSIVAERESWRKEINRPIYHLHKWWAKRLGSVFRGALLGCVLPPDADLRTAFYSRRCHPDTRVLDPFMGSGTTVGEAHKLGMTALGRDINPVACEAVRVALGPINRTRLDAAFRKLEATVGTRIRDLYRSKDGDGEGHEVLYFFWVKQVPCPACTTAVDLFDSYVFAKNAYPSRKPEVQVFCPNCTTIFPALHGQRIVECPECAHRYDPQAAPVRGQKAKCTDCGEDFAIAKAVKAFDGPPTHRLYAKLILTDAGEKKYRACCDADRQAFADSERLLRAEMASGAIRLPDGILVDGYNTRQALNYNYRRWRDFFNARQLLALGWLQSAIAALPDGPERDALLLLFSGALEFNNLFASYKGEGTGAVRHMFSHHILKPERTPIEANVWGTAKSSGSFSGLYRSRLLKALDYRDSPFEVALAEKGKIGPVAAPLGQVELASWPTSNLVRGAVMLSCGNSADLGGIPAESVDFVVTDPPFFDNVHYSELADFFFSWQTLTPRGFILPGVTTRREGEVQDAEAVRFGGKLGAVFAECNRVLRESGLLVFTYHHSRADGWMALANAVYSAGFSIVCAHPVRSEMAGATPKSQSRSPILIDAVLVCRKREQDTRTMNSGEGALTTAYAVAQQQVRRLASVGQGATDGDCAVILTAQFFAALGPVDAVAASRFYESVADDLKVHLDRLREENRDHETPAQAELAV